MGGGSRRSHRRPWIALISRGILARRLGHLQQAKDYFTDAAARFDRSGDIYGRAIAREFLGLVALRLWRICAGGSVLSGVAR